MGLSRGDWVQGAEGVQAELVLARAEASALCPALDGNGDKQITDAELAAALPLLPACVAERVAVDSDGGRCPARFEGANLTEEDGLALRATYLCPRAGRTTVELAALLSELSPGHRHLGRAITAQGQMDVVAFAANSAFSFGATAPGAQLWGYLRLGVEHILLGFDHLVFLLGLVLVGGRKRALLGVITAFTVAHSVSLALAVLGVVAPSPRLVEPLIALSIAWVGVENFFVRNADGRWRITAPFGFIHGFGFAGALAEIGVPRDAVAPALLLFNAGVELGQLAVLALVLPLLWVLRAKVPLFARHGRVVLSVLVTGAGLFWLVQRVWLG